MAASACGYRPCFWESALWKAFSPSHLMWHAEMDLQPLWRDLLHAATVRSSGCLQVYCSLFHNKICTI